MKRMNTFAICRKIYFFLLVVPAYVFGFVGFLFGFFLGPGPLFLVIALCDEFKELAASPKLPIAQAPKLLVFPIATIFLLGIWFACGIIVLPAFATMVILSFVAAIVNNLSFWIFAKELSKENDMIMEIDWQEKIKPALVSKQGAGQGKRRIDMYYDFMEMIANAIATVIGYVCPLSISANPNAIRGAM